MYYYKKHALTQKDFRKVLRLGMTDAETILWECIRNGALGIKFRRQISIGRYIVDFMSARPMIVIELDGGYHDDYEQLVKDRNRDEILTKIGFKVLRFKNHEIETNLRAVLTIITDQILTLKTKQTSINSKLSTK